MELRNVLSCSPLVRYCCCYYCRQSLFIFSLDFCYSASSFFSYSLSPVIFSVFFVRCRFGLCITSAFHSAADGTRSLYFVLQLHNNRTGINPFWYRIYRTIFKQILLLLCSELRHNKIAWKESTCLLSIHR